MDILDSKERTMIQQLKKQIEKNDLDKIQTLNTKQKKEIKSKQASLNSALESFDSEKFIVTCVGMLKAGKSTLVNLFSRNENASSTGFGFDTTLRPALISYTEEKQGCIEIWLPCNQDTQLKNVLNDVFACLRGIKTPSEVKDAMCKSYPLTGGNLKQALCEKVMVAGNNMLPMEPVMVVVKVPQQKDSLLNSEIMVLDTPGLDSGISEWTCSDSKRYEWIIEHSDLFLFLQSSVAPLNKTAKDVLGMIHDKKPQTPIWLIQNEMMVKPWYCQERINRENEIQRDKAAVMFDQINPAYKKVYANLGKAYSAIFDPDFQNQQQLLEESYFLTMEEMIRDELKQNSGPIIRKNCIADVKRECNALNDELSTIQQDIAKEREQLEVEITDLDNNIECIKNFFNDPPPEKVFQVLSNPEEIETDKTFPFQKTKLIQLIRSEQKNKFKNKKYSSLDLENIIIDCKNKLVEGMEDELNKISLRHFKFQLSNGIQISSPAKYILSRFQDYVISLKSNTVFSNEFEDILLNSIKSVAIPEFPKALGINVPSLDNVDTHIGPCKSKVNKMLHIEIIKYDDEDAKIKFQGFCDFETKTGKFIELIDDCDKTIKKELFDWVNVTVYDFLKKSLTDNLDGQITATKERKQSKADSLQIDSDILEGLKNTVKKIMNDIGNL